MQLTLSSENVQDTTMTNSDGQVIFKTTTYQNRLSQTTTTIYKMDMYNQLDTLAKIEWHTYSSSKFHMGGIEVKTAEFIPSSGFTGRTRTFLGPDEKSYEWTLGHKVPSLKRGGNVPVANFHRTNFAKQRSSYLEIFSNDEDMVDMIVLTFIYVEKLRKDRARLMLPWHISP